MVVTLSTPPPPPSSFIDILMANTIVLRGGVFWEVISEQD